MTVAFKDVDTWIFDLDNTLYAPEARLFDQIEVRMTEWVVDALGVDSVAANEIRKRYWSRFGTTLAGLMREHDVDPEAYLDYVHDISLEHLEPDPELASAIAGLPGRAIVYTNGSEPYARRVIEARGLSGIFDAVYGNYMRKCQNPVIGQKDVAVSFRSGHAAWEGAGNARSPEAHAGANTWP